MNSEHTLLERLVKGLSKGLATSLIVKGDMGVGKTETVLSTLRERNLRRNKHYLFIQNYATPLALYNLLQEVNKLQEPKILVLDDAEMTLKNPKATNLLKGALWTANGKREVCWLSTSVERQSFVFEGRIVFIVNELNENNKLTKALIDRGFYMELNLTAQEKIELMLNQAKSKSYKGLSKKDRVKVAKTIAKEGRTSAKLSLRALKKGYNLRILSPHTYQHLIAEMFS